MAMNYELYKKMAIRDMSEKVRGYYPDAEIRVTQVKKVNDNRDCILIIRNTEDYMSGMIPNMYISDMYIDYLQCCDYEKSIINAWNKYEEMYTNQPNIDLVVRSINNAYVDIENHIYMQLINRAANKELLESCPSVPVPGMPDLAVIFRLELMQTEGMKSSIKIKNSDVESGKIPQGNDLYKIALKSSARLDPAMAFKLSDIMRIVEDDNKYINDLNDIKIPVNDLGNEYFTGEEAIIITNHSGIDGAGCILYDGILDMLEEKMGESFYIIPSSKHEVIIIRQRNCELDELAAIVAEANTHVVGIEDRLSYNIYKYERHRLSVAYESTNKNITDVGINIIIDQRR